jgi:hypothetical protein
MIAFLLIGLLGDATAAPATSDPLEVISAYAGTWRGEIEHQDSEFSKASKASDLIHNDCWRANKFYACAQTVNGAPGALLVFTWDEKAKAYVIYPIPPDGGPAGRGKLVVDGDTWIFPWDQEKDGATIRFRVVNHFIGRDTIEYRQEYSRDGTNWTVIGRGLEKRVDETH